MRLLPSGTVALCPEQNQYTVKSEMRSFALTFQQINAQVPRQLVVLGFNYATYVDAAETGILYTGVVKCP